MALCFFGLKCFTRPMMLNHTFCATIKIADQLHIIADSYRKPMKVACKQWLDFNWKPEPFDVTKPEEGYLLTIFELIIDNRRLNFLHIEVKFLKARMKHV